MQFTTLQYMQQWKIHREVLYELDKLTFQTFVIDHLLGMHLFASLHFDIISIFLFTSQYFLSDFQKPALISPAFLCNHAFFDFFKINL